MKMKDMQHADLRGNHDGSCFARTNLFCANLSGGSFRNTSFRESLLREVAFAGADLSGADLSGADLFKSDFEGARVTNAIFTGATMPDGRKFREWEVDPWKGVPVAKGCTALETWRTKRNWFCPAHPSKYTYVSGHTRVQVMMAMALAGLGIDATIVRRCTFAKAPYWFSTGCC